LKAGVLGNEQVSSILKEIAGKDPRMALDWLSGLPGEFRTSPATGISREWAKKEPLAAIQWCLENGVDPARADWHGLSSWDPSPLGGAMEKAPTEIFEWLSALPAGNDRDRLLETAFMESMWHTPGKQLFGENAAMAWEFYNALPEDSQIARASLFGQKRVEYDRTGDPSAWIQDFPSGAIRQNAIDGAMGALYQRNAASAEKFLAAMAPGPDYDAALGSMSMLMSRKEPAAAAERAMQISNEVLRQETLQAIVVPWLQREAENSQKWLQSAAVPDAWKTAWKQSGPAR
jgi:hypothetical protein